MNESSLGIISVDIINQQIHRVSKLDDSQLYCYNINKNSIASAQNFEAVYRTMITNCIKNIESSKIEIPGKESLKDYIFAHFDLHDNLPKVCLKLTSLFPEIEKFTLKVVSDCETPDFKFINIIFNQKQLSKELDKRIREFYLSDTFDFLKNSDSFISLSQKDYYV